MISSFFTIQKNSEGYYKEKGSKFLAFAYPVTKEEEIKKALEVLKKQFHDARHHCFAYVLGFEGNIFRVNDDGEPSHTAGDPILAAIRSKNLTNVLVVVVRYFGGTKLGVGGLIHAYRTSAEDALEAAGIIEQEILQKFIIRFSYPNTGEVMSLINKSGANIIEQNFKEDCELKLEIAIRSAESLKGSLTQLASQKIINSFEISSG